MVKRKWTVAALAVAEVLSIGAAMLALNGCTDEQITYISRWNRQREAPPDYNDMPLGISYDSPGEVAQLKDQTLRNWMNEWLTLRETYLTTWQQYGEHDDRVQRIRNRRATWKAMIQDRVNQLTGMGQPLS